MTKFDSDQVLEAFEAKVGAPTCPYCGTTVWELQPDFVQLPQSSVMGGHVESGILPGVAAICTGCGHIAVFSALKHGLNLKP